MSNHTIDIHPERVLELILQSLKDLLHYELAVILKLDDSRHLSVRKADGPLVNNKLKSFQIDLNKRLDIAEIMSNDAPFLFSQEIPHIDTYDQVIDLPALHSCLVAPLHINDTPIGLMTLDNSACGMFTPTIVQFVGTVAKLIAVIINQQDSSIRLLSRQKELMEERNILLGPENEEFSNILGNSLSWKSVIEMIRTVAASDVPVLIQGETGTGKEAVARAIHDLSVRNDKPFITLNCSALNANIAESELFGHEKGAFTSAVIKRKGRFDLADGGTLFLDEIADLPAEIQPKILRTLQEGTYERVGGEKTLHTNVRIIAASNKDLRYQVKKNLFREDLYYRLGVFPIFLPPLREREGDVIILAEKFLSKLKENNRYSHHYLTKEAVKNLTEYNWPGNVRELQNVIQRSALIASDGVIDSEHLALSNQIQQIIDRAELPGNDRGIIKPSFSTLDEAVKRHIVRALDLCDGKIYNSDGAAALLGMKPTTLQSRMKKLGIKRK